MRLRFSHPVQICETLSEHGVAVGTAVETGVFVGSCEGETVDTAGAAVGEVPGTGARVVGTNVGSETGGAEIGGGAGGDIGAAEGDNVTGNIVPGRLVGSKVGELDMGFLVGLGVGETVGKENAYASTVCRFRNLSQYSSACL